MRTNPTLRRGVAVALSVACFGLLAVAVACQRGAPTFAPETKADEKKDKKDKAAPAVWGGSVSRNLVNLFDKDVPTQWNAEKGTNVLWVENLGSKAYGGPIVAEGKIFVGTNNNRPRNKDVKGDKGIIMCFRESDGSFLWQRVHDKLEGGRAYDWPEEGICSSPVVENGKIWYVSNRCEVVCATTDGKDVWSLDMMGKLSVSPHNLATCSPLIVGDKLFVITSNGVDLAHRRVPAPDAPSFLCLDKNDGKVLWSSKLPGNKIMHGQWSNPVYAEVKGQPQVIFPGGDGLIYSFEPEKGELLWKFDCNPKGSVYRLGEAGTRNDFVSTPIVVGDLLYIGVGQDPEHKKGVGWLWCVDISKKPANKEKDLSPWSDPKEEKPKGFDAKDPRNKDSALVWCFGGDNPDEKSPREYLFERTLSTCAVHDGLLFTADFAGNFYCFDAKTGKKHWETELGQDTWASPYVVDGKVYMGNEAGVMHVFEASSKMKLVSKVEMKGKIRVTPVVVNGVMYVMTENPCRLHAVKKK